ncbi:hypothetical protein PRZ48_015275 [Zasmidium cellare]|uniref:Major facilitator superfamily (MFS) profile domain-containing protein n=1 Tax=Zasmidium cellare TaxID=395010 RepID=A0ABR0DWM9_ZASCE|nr:hypothetical protein PRZ48_015275 [Zasmidium cellare]
MSERNVSFGEDSTTSQEGNEKETMQPKAQQPRSVFREILFLAVLCSAQLFTQSALAMTILPQHLIGLSLGIADDAGKLSWTAAGYSLTVGTFILIAGRLGDVFGYKRFFVGGFLWFSLWSLLAGFAVYSNIIFFAFCRGMQGIGPAFMLPNAIAIISRAYEPGMKQNLAFSLFGALAPGGFVLGATFSSLLAERVWWPWAFWVMSAALLLAAVLAMVVVPPTSETRDLMERTEDNSSSIWQRVDIYGSITGVASLVLFNFAWNQAPVVGWQVPYTYILLIIGMLLFVVFILIEKRVRHPLVPFGVLKIDSVFTLACIAAGWSSFGIYAYYSLDFLQVQRALSPLLTSAQFSPAAASGLFAAVTTGLALSRLKASTVMLIALTFFLTGGLILSTMDVHQSYWAQTFPGNLILPWGMDMSFPAATIILSRSMSREHQGLAASLVNTFVNYSISLSLGVAGTVSSQLEKDGGGTLRGTRGALYLGVGLAGLGVGLALVFWFVERFRSEKPSEGTAEEKA